MQVKLRVLGGSNAGKEIAVRGSKFIIGRAEDANLRPHSDAISRRHCVLIVSGEVVGVRDLKSRNGTYLNNEKITSDRRLRNGDQLRVGPLEFEVVIHNESNQPATQQKTPKQKLAGSSTGGSKSGDDPGMGGMVSQWLEEADEFAREEQRLAAPETREYRFDETSRIALETAADDATQKKSESSDEKDDGKKAKKSDKKKKEPGKLPKFEVKGDAPKDTQEAASQVLRKLFNRG